MSVFTPQELAYMQTQRLGRLATVGADGMPHITPLGFFYNPDLDTIDIGGGRGGFGISKKFRDAQATGNVAFLLDDVDRGTNEREWHIRGIEVRGIAEAYETGFEHLHPGMDPAYIRIHPTRIVSWGINRAGYHPDARDVNVGQE